MSNKVKTVYIAGPITGDPKYRGKFSAAADMLMQRGYAVVNPVKMCWPIRWNPRYEVLAKCFGAVAGVECLALLPGWGDSKGANAEIEVFLRTHKTDDLVFLLDDDGYMEKVTVDDMFNALTRFDRQGVAELVCEEDEDVKRAIWLAKDKYNIEFNPR